MGRLSDTTLRRLAMAQFGLCIALDVLYVVAMRAVEGHPGLTYPDATVEQGEVVGIAVAAATGLVLSWFRPRNPVGWLLGASGLALAFGDAAEAYGACALLLDSPLPAGGWVLALFAPLWVTALAIGPTLLLVRYPSGRIEGRWPRRFERATLAGLVALHAGYSLTPNPVTDMVEDGNSPLEAPELVAGSLAALGGVVLVVSLVLVVGDAVRRLVRSGTAERRALLLVLTTSVAAVLMAFFGPFEWLLTLAWLSVLVAVALGVLRYGALGIDLVVLTGAGNDPLAALNRLGTPLGRDADEASLGALLETLRQTLGADGVAVEGPITTTAGAIAGAAARIPLQFAGVELGSLVVASHPGQAGLGRAEQRLVDAVAPLVAAVVHSARATAELREQQARVLDATEAERRRLRQELHDGLGPALTGIGLGLEALAPRVPEAGGDLVSRLRAEVAGSLEETRRIIDDLRPSALDGGDLLAALRRRAEQVRSSGIDVLFDVPNQLPPLPAAVSVAALRIVEEALTNVVRHAHAGQVRLTLRADDELHLEVADDGVGPGPGRAGRVGLSSMRERAERLGGRCTVAATMPGTTVRADLPLAVRP